MMVRVVFIPTSRQPNMLGPVSLVVQLGISFSWKKSGCSPATAFVAVWLLSNTAVMLICWKKVSNQQRHQGAFPPADFAPESSGKTSQQPICPRIQLFKCFPIHKKANLTRKTQQTIHHTIWQILVASFFFHLWSLGLVHFGAEI